VESALFGAAFIAAFFLFKGSSGSDNGISEGDESLLIADDYFFYYDGDEMVYQMSDAGLNALKQRETIGGKFAAKKYPDHKGYSIGYGHLIKPGEFFAEPMSEQTATELLNQDVALAESTVFDAVQIPLNQNQFDALVSFTYNVGVNAFRKSTLLKKINNLDPTAINEFSRWVYASGVLNDGLVSRREAELNQFMA
jgi:lysozyme